MKNPFWESPTYKIIQAMKATGNRPGVVARWKSFVEAWANRPENRALPEAVAVRAWLPYWQVRPFYTAAELAPIWPALAVALGVVDRPFPAIPAKRLEFMLDYGGLPRIDFARPQFFIIERIHYWVGASHGEIEKEFPNAHS